MLPYTSDDIVFAKRLIDAGAARSCRWGAPIGSGMGIQNQAHIRILREMITGVPLIVDAGVGTASDAAIAMELGADAVLMNTGIAAAQDPVLMAEAMHHAVARGAPGLPFRTHATKVVRYGEFSAGRGRAVGTRQNAGGGARVARSKNKKGRLSPPSGSKPQTQLHHHLDASHVHGILAHGAGDCDVMALMALQRVLVVDGKHFRIAIGDDDHLLTASHALFGAGLAGRIGAFGAAFCIGDPPVDGSALAHVIERHRRQGKYEAYRKTNRPIFLMAGFSPL